MENIKLSDQEVQRIHEQYVNDPNIKRYLNIKADIVSKAIPKYIVNRETKEVTTVYDENTQFALDKIDEKLNSLHEKYYKILNQ